MLGLRVLSAVAVVVVIGCLKQDSPTEKKASDTVPELVELLKRGNAKEQERALRQLIPMNEKAAPAVPVLIDLASDSNETIRALALAVIGRTGVSSDRILELLASSCEDKVWGVR